MQVAGNEPLREECLRLLRELPSGWKTMAYDEESNLTQDAVTALRNSGLIEARYSCRISQGTRKLYLSRWRVSGENTGDDLRLALKAKLGSELPTDGGHLLLECYGRTFWIRITSQGMAARRCVESGVLREIAFVLDFIDGPPARVGLVESVCILEKLRTDDESNDPKRRGDSHTSGIVKSAYKTLRRFIALVGGNPNITETHQPDSDGETNNTASQGVTTTPIAELRPNQPEAAADLNVSESTESTSAELNPANTTPSAELTLATPNRRSIPEDEANQAARELLKNPPKVGERWSKRKLKAALERKFSGNIAEGRVAILPAFRTYLEDNPINRGSNGKVRTSAVNLDKVTASRADPKQMNPSEVIADAEVKRLAAEQDQEQNDPQSGCWVPEKR